MAKSAPITLLPETAEAKRRLWFMLIAIAVIGLINFVMGQLLTRSINDRLLVHEAEVAQEFLTSVLRSEGTEDVLFAKPDPSPALLTFAGHLQHLPHIVRANIYSPDGFIRYSTEKNLIGVKFSGNKELEEAFQGRLFARMEEVTDDTKAEHLAVNRTDSDHLIEAYIPISGVKGGLVGVVELYRLPASVPVIANDVEKIVWLAAVLGGVITFLAFYVFFVRPYPGTMFDEQA